MRLHRFFIDSPAGEAGQDITDSGEIVVPDAELTHQLRRVFRYSAGDKVILFNGDGFEYISEIISFGKEETTFRVTAKEGNQNVSKVDVYLFASIIKNSNYEWILEKCTELGVSNFVPIVSERSEKKKINYTRAEKIVKEASEQSGRGTLPKIFETILLQNIFEEYNFPCIAFHVEGESFRQSNIQYQISNAKENKIGILIGPEGGWSEKEIELLKEKNIPLYSLGNQVLRAETAAIAVSSLLLL